MKKRLRNKIHNKRKLTKKEIYQILAIPLTGIIVTAIISLAQICITSSTTKTQQKLFAMQLFSDRLVGDRINRELSLELIDNLDDEELSLNLKDISNRATIEKLRDSIWSKSEKSRVEAIIEYAKLYKNYPDSVLDALRPRYKSHLDSIAPMISISQFFTYLYRYSGDSTWKGTIEDSLCFARMKESRHYKDSLTSNVHSYLDRGLNNFRRKSK